MENTTEQSETECSTRRESSRNWWDHNEQITDGHHKLSPGMKAYVVCEQQQVVNTQISFHG